jgi:hypothetical protein
MSLIDYAVSHPGCGRSVTDFLGWGAHKAQLRCPMRWMVIYEYEVPGGALNLSSTELPRPWSPWGSSLYRKNLHGRTGNRTRDLIISSQKLWLDHEAGQTHGKLRYVYGLSTQQVLCVHLRSLDKAIQADVIRQAMYILRNSQARSCNRCCCGKAISSTQHECVYL